MVEVAGKAKEQLRIKAAAEAAESRGYPEWLEVDAKALKGTFKARPQRSELPSTINEIARRRALLEVIESQPRYRTNGQQSHF